MKYILTESQLKNLSEQSLPIWFKRRYNAESVGPFIEQQMEDYLDCNDYEGVDTYLVDVVTSAVSHFLTLDEEIFEHPQFEEFQENLVKSSIDMYGHMIAMAYEECGTRVNESLNEGKVGKIGAFQDLINNNFEYIRKHCDEYNADNYPGDISFDSCDQIEAVSEMKVINVESMLSSVHPYDSEEMTLLIKLMVYYNSNRQHGTYDADELVYDIQQMVKKSTGLPIKIIYETTNTNKNFDW